MAQSPFTTTSLTYPGQALPRDHSRTRIARPFWLGTPGNMIQLPASAVGYNASPTRGEVIHQLMNGGTTVTKRRSEKRTWQFTWPPLVNRDLQIIRGFYRGLFGDGPYCFLNPEDDNRLGPDTSLVRPSLLGLWTIGAGILAFDAAVPPVTPNQVISWASATTGKYLLAGTQPAGVLTPDLLGSSPYVPDAAWTFSIWAQATTATAALQFGLLGLPAAGTASPVTFFTTSSATTTWTQFSVTVAAGTAGWSQAATPYIVPAVKCNQTSMPTVRFANPQLEYGVSIPSPWQAGNSLPRVTILQQSRTVEALFANAVQMTLAQI